MADVSPDVLRRFLLGALSPDEADAIGARLVDDDAFGDAMADAEEALIADHLAGTLPAAARAAFERVYLATPGHRARVETMRALTNRVNVEAPATAAAAGLSRWWAVAASLLLIAGLWWTQPAPASRGAVATPTAAPDAPAVTPPAAPGTPAAQALPIVALTLTPVVTRGSGAPPVAVVPRGTAQVALRLVGDLPAAADLTAEIAALDRDEIKRWPVDDAAPGADGATRAVVVPPYAVPPGDFVLTLWAGDADIVQRYAFRIVDK